MPSKLLVISNTAAELLIALGKRIREQRKFLRVSAIVAAEAAGMSRITLHRIEKGEPSVTMGAYLNAAIALGMEIGVVEPLSANAGNEERQGWLPTCIRLVEYPQLKQLAWQVQGTDELKPVEAFGIYERNARHLDLQALEPRERNLIEALRLVYGALPQDV